MSAFFRRVTSVQLVRIGLILGLDAVAVLVSFEAAVLLRLDGWVPPQFREAVRVAAPLIVAVRLATGLVAGLHRWSFRMSGFLEAARLVAATLLGSALFLALFLAVGPGPLPRTVYALEFFFSTTLLAVIRFSPRFVQMLWAEQTRRHSDARRTIIVGAGGAGDLLIRDLKRSPGHGYFVVGFVDDARTKLGTTLGGKPVLGTIDDLPRLVARHRVTMVLLAITHLPAERIRHILDLCASARASFKIVPASPTARGEKLSAAMLHDLAPEDLLPRASVGFDPAEIRRLVRGRAALVTGAGGSIGGEICRQLAQHEVRRLVMVDMNENELYLGARRLREEHPFLEVHAEVADIREPLRIRRLCERHRPEQVFHAAAHKHVPLMEDAPEEAIKNNVLGTLHVARAASECGAAQFVLISTDKAVNPTSVMGASKRLAELVVRDVARTSRTRMTAVRFGNVLGSAGSVVPIFKRQIERGGPVTVTHPECTRYFMTIPEAVGLVLLAGLGGYGELCILDMGEPIKIADLARNLITMAGLVPEVEIPIVYTGLRPGEKLFEELLTEEEERTHAVRDRIKVAKSPPPPPHLDERLDELRSLARGGDREAILAALVALVPSYRFTPARPAAQAGAAVDGAEVAYPVAGVIPLRPAAGLRPS